jgi:hypothetical protein
MDENYEEFVKQFTQSLSDSFVDKAMFYDLEANFNGAARFLEQQMLLLSNKQVQNNYQYIGY